MTKHFVEIGAANFETLLPLAKMGWSGIVVEPVPYLAEQLKEMFYGYDVTIIQKAVSDYNGEVELIVSNEDSWVTGISHIVSENHLGVKLSEEPENKNNFSETISVPCVTLDTLLNNYDHVDLMKVDTEGHELNIFMNYSFKIKPSLIKVEHKHIDDNILRRKLETNGYMVWTEKDDLYAVN